MSERSVKDITLQEMRNMELELSAAEPLPATGPSFAPLDLKGVDSRILSALDPLTMMGEQFRNLRARLSLLKKQKGTKLLLVTSATPGEGKTFVSCGLAMVLAQTNPVLLIDADLRKGEAGERLGVPGRSVPGLVNLLEGSLNPKELLLSVSETGLFLLPAGGVTDEPAELLASPKMESLLNSLKGLFEWVIIDCSPIISFADSNLLASLCDAVVVVVRADVTAADIVRDCIQKIGRDRICGLIINGVYRLKGSKYYFRYHHPSKDGR